MSGGRARCLVFACVLPTLSCGRTGLYPSDNGVGGAGEGTGAGGVGAGGAGLGGKAAMGGRAAFGGLGGLDAGSSGSSGVGGTGSSGGAPDVTALRTGAFRTCAIASGRLRCWGSNGFGELGYGHTMDIGDDEVPRSAGDVDVGGRVLDVGIGDVHACALLEGGQVRCWGNNITGALGLGRGSHVTIGDDELPTSEAVVDVGGVVTKLAVGSRHTCALMEDGTVRCWGDNNDSQLGIGGVPNRIGDNESPADGVPVDLGEPALDIAAGSLHTCALFAGGRVRCWGEGSSAQLGYGNLDTVGDDEPVREAGYVDVGGPVVALAPGGQHTCALLDSGNVRCWGIPAGGILGYADGQVIGDDEVPAVAGDVDVGSKVVQLSATHGRTCALLAGGTVRCWGDGSYGHGYGHSRDVGSYSLPSAEGDIDLGGEAHALSTGGGRHGCALLDEGRVRCWGYGPRGALGYGYLVPRDTIGDDETPASTDPVEIF